MRLPLPPAIVLLPSFIRHDKLACCGEESMDAAKYWCQANLHNFWRDKLYSLVEPGGKFHVCQWFWLKETGSVHRFGCSTAKSSHRGSAYAVLIDVASRCGVALCLRAENRGFSNVGQDSPQLAMGTFNHARVPAVKEGQTYFSENSPGGDFHMPPKVLIFINGRAWR